MEELRKKFKESLKNGIFESTEQNDEYIEGLKLIEAKHKFFFENKPKGKNKIEDYAVPNNFRGETLIGLSYESELTPELKVDLNNLSNQVFNKKK